MAVAMSKCIATMRLLFFQPMSALIERITLTLTERIGVDVTLVLFNNSLFSYGLAVVLFAVLVFVFRVIQWVILRRLARLAERTETDIDDTLITIVKSLRPAFYYFVAFFFAVKVLVLHPALDRVVEGVLVIWVVYQGVLALQILIDQVLRKRLSARAAGEGETAAVGYVKLIAKVALWSVALLLVLSNFGINVTSLIAGLGIGGIAIAFAVQNILADLFSSFVIYFDKPFEVGDLILASGQTGTVERVGIKTTRLRSLQGEEIVMSNRELTSSIIKNYKKMKERRNAFTFGVLYETPNEKLEEIPNMVREIFETIKNVRLDRVHFKSMDESALTYEVVFYVDTPDYALYLDRQQEINLALKGRLEKGGISFAYPTQTIYLNK